MLFTAGYLWTAYYETLSKAKGAEHGFTVQVYDTQLDAIQAVVSGAVAGVE